jgi:hypothetical protein
MAFLGSLIILFVKFASIRSAFDPFGLTKYNEIELQARFAVIKYLNSLVTPLLHYIDISLFSLYACNILSCLSASTGIKLYGLKSNNTIGATNHFKSSNLYCSY